MVDLTAPTPTLSALGTTPVGELTAEQVDQNFIDTIAYAEAIAGVLQVGHYSDGSHKDRAITSAKLGAGPIIFSEDTGAADALIISPDPAVTAYNNGDIYLIQVAHDNTGASTLKVNDLSALEIRKNGGNLEAGDLITGQIIIAVYCDGVFEMLTRGAGTTSTSYSDTLETELPITTASSWTEVLSVDVAAGTYQVTAQVTVRRSTSINWYFRIKSVLEDSTTTNHASALRISTQATQSLTSLVTMVTSGSIKVEVLASAATVGSPSYVASNLTNSSGTLTNDCGANATQMVAVRMDLPRCRPGSR